MATITTGYDHVVLNENNVPVIKGTTMKVVELVRETIAYGWSPEELKFQHPYLSMGQIYSALAYYADHRDEMRQDIEKRFADAEQSRESVGSTLPPRSPKKSK
jgi:uncharacterized protein (DUF433 family)